jgi:GxxExxY protein
MGYVNSSWIPATCAIALAMDENDISYLIRGAIFEVYNYLGPGLLESVYVEALNYELVKRGLTVETQKPMKVAYKALEMSCGFRADMLVNDKVIVEIKSVENLMNVHHAQLLTYLKATNRKLGLLVNFNTDNITQSIIRKVNQLG